MALQRGSVLPPFLSLPATERGQRNLHPASTLMPPEDFHPINWELCISFSRSSLNPPSPTTFVSSRRVYYTHTASTDSHKCVYACKSAESMSHYAESQHYIHGGNEGNPLFLVTHATLRAELAIRAVFFSYLLQCFNHCYYLFKILCEQKNERNFSIQEGKKNSRFLPVCSSMSRKEMQQNYYLQTSFSHVTFAGRIF